MNARSTPPPDPHGGPVPGPRDPQLCCFPNIYICICVCTLSIWRPQPKSYNASSGSLTIYRILSNTLGEISIRENPPVSIGIHRDGPAPPKKSGPEMHRVVRTARVLCRHCKSREALRCHRNPFELQKKAEMDFLGVWGRLERCNVGIKHALWLHCDASRGQIFSPPGSKNPGCTLMGTRGQPKFFLVSRRNM